MTWLFLQTWFWHLVAFLLGALITWLLFTKPWSRQRGAHERADSAASAASRDLTAARARVSSLETDLAACKKGRAEDNEASQREIGGLRIKLERANAPAGAGVLGAERADEDITMTSDLTAAAAGVRAGTDKPLADTKPGGSGTALDEAATGSVASDTATDASDEAEGDADAGTAKPQAFAGGGAPQDAPYGPGSAKSLPDGSAPEGFTIKGNADSGLFHTVDSPWYGRTKAEAWFDTEETAKAAGFTHWKDRNNKDRNNRKK